MKIVPLKLFVVLFFAKFCDFIMVFKTSVNEGSNTSQSSSKENPLQQSQSFIKCRNARKSNFISSRALLQSFNENSSQMLCLKTKLAQDLHTVSGLILMSSMTDLHSGWQTAKWISELKHQTFSGKRIINITWNIASPVTTLFSASRKIIGYSILNGIFWSGNTFV